MINEYPKARIRDNKNKSVCIWIQFEDGTNMEIEVTDKAYVIINGEDVPKSLYRHTLE